MANTLFGTIYFKIQIAQKIDTNEGNRKKTQMKETERRHKRRQQKENSLERKKETNKT
jgi:hypothetical protein